MLRDVGLHRGEFKGGLILCARYGSVRIKGRGTQKFQHMRRVLQMGIPLGLIKCESGQCPLRPDNELGVGSPAFLKGLHSYPETEN